MSDIIDFFNNKVVHPNGYSLSDIIDGYSNDKLEKSHDIIQWLFPLSEPSHFNPDAPLLTQEDIDYFSSLEARYAAGNYYCTIHRMLAFFGLKISFSPSIDYQTDVELADDFEARKYTWAEAFNHNHLRITRMLKSMVLLGWGEWARAICDFLVEYKGDSSGNNDWKVNENSKQYWIEAVQQ